MTKKTIIICDECKSEISKDQHHIFLSYFISGFNKYMPNLHFCDIKCLYNYSKKKQILKE
jgi:hypothetical protein